jgi:hypothetical protein
MVLKFIESHKKDIELQLVSVDNAALKGIGNIGLAFAEDKIVYDTLIL